MFLYSLLSTVYAVERFEPIAKWLTIGLLAAVLVIGALVFFFKRSVFGAYAKAALIGSFCYLLLLGIVFFALDIAKNYSDSYTEENWLDKQTLTKFVLIPLLILCSVCLLSLAAYAIIVKRNPEKKKVFAEESYEVPYYTDEELVKEGLAKIVERNI
jgi:Ni/Fe-hydrogenase subunit HybB-like protein